jgi:membrane-associated phospholipid phosphatase
LATIPSIAYGSTFYHDDKKGRKEFYKSFLSNASLTYTLKYAINRERPNGKNYSFPSGHTSATFQSASFIHKRYGLKKSLPLYLGAMFTGYSRIESEAHHTGDVIAGAIIGTLSSFYFTNEYNGFQIQPNIQNSNYGFTINKKF